jgi:hypothetical protein
MTEQHPITPPLELLNDCYDLVQKHVDKGFALQFGISHALRHAYTAGADQELEECCEWLVRNYNYPEAGNPLRTARRPNPPSLKDQALAALNEIQDHMLGPTNQEKLIRLALEALDD